VPILRLLVDEFARRLKKVLEDSLHFGQQVCLSPMSKANFSKRVALNRIVVLLISFTVVLCSSGRISANTTSSFLNLFENCWNNFEAVVYNLGDLMYLSRIYLSLYLIWIDLIIYLD
jgi:hypothetical protein